MLSRAAPAAACLLLAAWPSGAGPPASAARAESVSRRRRASSAPTTSSSTPDFDPVDAELAPRLRPGPAGSVRRARRHRALVADPARSREPRARRRLLGRVERAIDRPRRGRQRAPDDAEAWFYLGGAYAARVQWRVLRDERLAAARDGKRIKDALERALALDPGLDDALLRPRAVSVLRGRRADGREDPAIASAAPGRRSPRRAGADAARAQRGRLLQGEADYQLHIVYLWYERQHGAGARSCCRRSAASHPAQSALPGADRRDPGRLPARRHGEPRDLARAARAGARASGSTRPAWPRCDARLGIAASSTRCADRRGHRSPRPRDRAQAGGAVCVARAARICGWAQPTIAWAARAGAARPIVRRSLAAPAGDTLRHPRRRRERA